MSRNRVSSYSFVLTRLILYSISSPALLHFTCAPELTLPQAPGPSSCLARRCEDYAPLRSKEGKQQQGKDWRWPAPSCTAKADSSLAVRLQRPRRTQYTPALIHQPVVPVRRGAALRAVEKIRRYEAEDARKIGTEDGSASDIEREAPIAPGDILEVMGAQS